MINLRIYTIAIACFLFVSCGNNHIRKVPNKVNINIDQTVIIDSTNSKNTGILYSAYDLQVANNRLYIADNMLNSILIYSQEGEFIHSFGETGRGPGEFTAIKGFAVLDGAVYVYDQNLKLLNKFSLQGDLLESITMKIASSPIDIYKVNNNYLIFHPNKDIRNINTIGHLYDKTFTRISNLINFSEIDDGLKEVIYLILTKPGRIVNISEDSLVYVPYVYTGNLFIYTRNKDNNWSYSGLVQGYIQNKPLGLLDETSDRKPDFSVTTPVGGENKYILHNTSRGLIKSGDYILHFTKTDSDSARTFGVEVYNMELELLGYKSIESISFENIIKNEHNNLYWYVDDIDSEGFVYMRQRFPSKGVSRIVKMRIAISKTRS